MIAHNDIRWRKYQGALMPDVPPHIAIEISYTDVRYLLKYSRAYFLRWISDFDCDDETDFYYVIKSSTRSLEELSSNTRSKVRRGLKNCSVRKVDRDYIAVNAYDVYRKAFGRYEADSRPVREEEFSDGIRNRDASEWDFWAVFDKTGSLIAYSQNRLEDSSCNYSTIKFDPEGLRLYSSYALFFEMDNYYLNTLQLRYVNDGARSISHDTNVQNFLIDKFKFRKAYCKLHIAYRSDVRLLVMLLFPMRSFIGKFNVNPLKKISVLLLQEEMRRSGELY